MPSSPPPNPSSNAPVDTIRIADDELDFEDERSGPRALADPAPTAPIETIRLNDDELDIAPDKAAPRPPSASSAPPSLTPAPPSSASRTPPPPPSSLPRPSAAPRASRSSTPRLEAQKPPPPAAAPKPEEPANPHEAIANEPTQESAPAARNDAYAAGDIIVSKYRLKSVIGRGGMGSVWLAHNISLDIDVAIKLIRRDRAAPGAAERLKQEAKAAARLRHPVIVRVFDFGETERGDPFIAMELLHGESLSAVLARKRRLPPAVAVQTLLPVASALVEAHAKGIVHRDLKPDNILLVTDESGAVTPKIVDFGIAKLLDVDIERQLTIAGEVLGSPDYMSPEQARGDYDVGEGTDVWALSVVLYEAITGRRPFDGPNYNALIAAILTASPMPAGEFSECDGDLWSILARGLAKESSVRWQTIRELGTALAVWADGRGVSDDITGTSIAKQWLGSRARRLFTVFPEGEPPSMPSPAPSQPAMDASSPMSRPSMPVLVDRASLPSPERLSVPSWPAAPVQQTPSSMSVPDEWTRAPARKTRAPLVVLGAAAVLGVIGYVAVSMITPEGGPPQPAATAANTASIAPTAAAAPAATPAPPSASSSAAPSASASTSASAAQAAPTASAKSTATPKLPLRPTKPAAPQVPKHINF